MKSRKSFFVVLLIGLCVNSYGKTKISWLDLKPLKTYNQEEAITLLNNDIGVIKERLFVTSTRKIHIFFQVNDDLDYVYPKTSRNTKRLFIYSEPADITFDNKVQFVCLDSTDLKGGKIFKDDDNLLIYGQNENGVKVIFASIFMVGKLYFKAINNDNLVDGAFFGKDFYYWDANSKEVRLLRFNQNGSCDLFTNSEFHFEYPTIFVNNSESKKGVYITEVDKNEKPVTGEYWNITNLVFKKMDDRITEIE